MLFALRALLQIYCHGSSFEVWPQHEITMIILLYIPVVGTAVSLSLLLSITVQSHRRVPAYINIMIQAVMTMSDSMTVSSERISIKHSILKWSCFFRIVFLSFDLTAVACANAYMTLSCIKISSKIFPYMGKNEK